MSAVIDRVLQQIEEDWSGEKPHEQSARIGLYLEELRNRYKNLTPAEANARQQLNGLIIANEHYLARSELAQRYQVPLLSLEPLRWTQERRTSKLGVIPVPKLALLPLQNEQVKISADWWIARNSQGDWRRTRIDSRDRDAQTSYPKAIRECYQPLRETVAECQPRRTHFTLVWRFQHVIPDRVKETITEIAPSGDFEAMYLLADTQPEEWQVWEAKKEDDPREPRWQFDPLIVGWAHEALWLLDRFDATPLEQYLVSEFAVPVDHQLEAGE